MTLTTKSGSKKTAILNSKAPLSSTSPKDALDVALIFASFEQEVSLFFQGDGVRQLIKNQEPALVQVKDYLKTFAALEFYDIENLYVCEQSLMERGLSANFHVENVQVLSTTLFAEALASHQTIFRF